MTTESRALLQDYIIDVEAAKPKVSGYDVVLQNNSDFIIRRKTAKLEQDLVVLVSKDLYYLKNVKTGAVESLSESNLRTFLRNLQDGMIPLDQVLWMPHLFKESTDRIYRVVTDAKFAEMCRHNVMGNIREPSWYYRYWDQNSKLLIRLNTLFPTISDGKNGKYQNSIPLIYELERRYGANEAIYFAEQLVRSGIQSFECGAKHNYLDSATHDTDGFTRLLDKDFNLNLRRLIDYVLFDLYRQGYAKINSAFWTEYYDYLRMQKEFHGKIREKYPESLKTAHDVIALKVNLARQAAVCKDFSDRVGEVEHLAYEGMLGDHRVILLQLVCALDDRIVLVDALGELVYLVFYQFLAVELRLPHGFSAVRGNEKLADHRRSRRYQRNDYRFRHSPSPDLFFALCVPK